MNKKKIHEYENWIIVFKVSIWPKCFFLFSVLVSVECIEEYHIFATKLSFKVPAPATPNKDDRELLSLGPEQAVTSLQESSTLQPVYFNLSLYFHTNSIIFRIIYAKKWLILYRKTMKHWNEESKWTPNPKPEVRTTFSLFRPEFPMKNLIESKW